MADKVLIGGGARFRATLGPEPELLLSLRFFPVLFEGNCMRGSQSLSTPESVVTDSSVGEGESPFLVPSTGLSILKILTSF